MGIYRLYISINKKWNRWKNKEQNKFLNKKIKTNYSVRFGNNIKIADIEKISFGKNVFIGDNAFIRAGGGLSIGNNVIISRNVLIYTQSHNYNSECLPYDNTYIKKEVIIEDNVWIGMNVVIAPGTHIQEGSIIGIGARIYGNIPKCAIIGSNGKIIKYRDEVKYNKLKQEKKFCSDNGLQMDNDK